MPRKTGSVLAAPKLPAGLGGPPRPREQLPLAGIELPPLEVDDGNLTTARTATEWRRAQLMEIELQARQGDLIPRATVEKQNFAIARTLRNRVLGIAPRIAAEVFAGETVADCQRIIDRELRLALEVISEDLARADD